MSNDDDYAKSHTCGKRIKILEEVILGPPGKPDESLIVQVDKIAKSVKMLTNLIWTVAITGSGVIATKLFELITQ